MKIASRFGCRRTPVLVSLLYVSSAIAQQLVPGQISVSPKGSLQYSIPIMVPAGAGIEPNLQLVYDSSVGAGNAGGGWSLLGLPRITRCLRTVAEDGVLQAVNFTSDDGYCLDGERLIAVNGAYGAADTEYRTEHDSFAKIVQKGAWTNPYVWDGSSQTYKAMNGGAQSFVVQTKSGQTMTFDGITGNGTYGPNFNSHPIKGWALSSVRDTAGNYMTVSYDKQTPNNTALVNGGDYAVDDGAFYPSSIAYRGDDGQGGSQIIVNLAWSLKSDSISPTALHYVNGVPVSRTGYLKGITTTPALYHYALNPSGKPVDSPFFVGDLPFLSRSLSVCGNASAIVSCMPEVFFTYEPDNDSGHPLQASMTGSAFPGQQKDYRYYFVDVNGNGKMSWVQISQASDDAWIGSINSDSTFSASSWTKFSTAVGSLNDYEHYFADINGDGKADWIRISKTSNEAWIALGTGNGNFQAWTALNQPVNSEAGYAHFFADVNGDGRADMIEVSRTVDSASISMAGDGGGFLPWVKPTQQFGLGAWVIQLADVNGDGMSDLIVSNKKASTGSGAAAYLSRGDGTFSPPPSTILKKPETCALADINGDGNVDMVCQAGAVFISQGDGSFAAIKNQWTGTSVQLADMNGDGMADLLVNAGTGTEVARYAPARGENGFALLPASNVSGPLPGNVATPSAGGYDRYYVDLNGDGKADLVLVDRTTKLASVAINISGEVYRITSISDAKRGTTTIQYKPQNDPSVYTPDTDGVWPLRDAAYPLLKGTRAPYLVAAISKPNGIGSVSTTNYTYGGQKTDLNRRMVLGFRWTKSTQVDSGISTYSEYRQDWPFTGLPTKSTTTLGGDKVLQQISNIYDCMDFVSTTGCAVASKRRYFPYLKQSDTANWDIDGTILPATTTVTEVDTFGNPTRVVTSTSGGFSTTTVTEYTNDTAKWWIGRPTRTTVTKTTP